MRKPKARKKVPANNRRGGRWVLTSCKHIRGALLRMLAQRHRNDALSALCVWFHQGNIKLCFKQHLESSRHHPREQGWLSAWRRPLSTHLRLLGDFLSLGTTTHESFYKSLWCLWRKLNKQWQSDSMEWKLSPRRHTIHCGVYMLKSNRGIFISISHKFIFGEIMMLVKWKLQIC